MRFRVYRDNPVNINVGYRPFGTGDLSFLTDVELNFKYRSPTVITIESSFVFYYAIDENNNAWRTTNIEYITNQKVMLTMFSQTLECFKRNETLSYTAVGSINAQRSQFVNDFTFNKIASSPSTWLTNVPNQLVTKHNLTDDWEDYCIFQMAQPLAEEDSDITETFRCYEGISYLQRSPSAFINYGLLDNGVSGTLSVYTYVVSASRFGTTGGWNIVARFFNELIQTRTDFINARFVKLPDNALGNAEAVVAKLKYKTDSDDVQRIGIGVLQSFTPEIEIVDSFQAIDLLQGNKCWKVGDNIIYPNVDSTSFATLKMVLIVGVGTCFGFFYTGNYKDLIENPTASCIIELGFNFAPNTINPSLYYTNKQYQGLLNATPVLNTGATLVGSIASVALMPKATLLGKGLMIGAGALTSGSNIIKNAQDIEKQKFNRATVNNTNDVQDIGNYFTKSIQVLRIEKLASWLTVYKDVIDGYAIPHNNYATDTFENSSPTILKARSIDGEINVDLITQGCLLATNTSLASILRSANI